MTETKPKRRWFRFSLRSFHTDLCRAIVCIGPIVAILGVASAGQVLAQDKSVRTRNGTVSPAISNIDEQWALALPPISVDVRNATLAQLQDALAESLGMKSYPLPSQGSARESTNSDRFTLRVNQRPFWEVFKALNEQHPVTFAVQYGMLRLISDSAEYHTKGGFRGGTLGGLQAMNGQGAFVAFLLEAARPNPADRAAGAAVEPALRIDYGIAADPRVRVLKIFFPPPLAILDEKGNNFADLNAAGMRGFVGTSGNIWGRPPFPLNLDIQPGMAAKIVLIKGEAHFTVQTEEEKVVLDNRQVGEPIKIGGGVVQLDEFTVTGTSLRLRVSAPQQAGPIWPISVVLLDSADEYIWGRLLTAGAQLTGPAGFSPQHTSPLKVQLTAPGKTKEIKVPYELKDIPLP
jgi:hypothetical protein